MPTYTIHDQAIPGFRQIIRLTESDLNSLREIFSNLKAGEGIKEIVEKALRSLSIEEEAIRQTIGSLFSLLKIYFNSGNTSTVFSADFTKSFKIKEKSLSDEELVIFQGNLEKLVSSFGRSLRNTLKARDLIIENPSNFHESRIISDIRVLYNEEVDSVEDEQLALLVHNLRIKFFSNQIPKGEFFVSLNLEDLLQLQTVVNRAIEKDKQIKKNNPSLTFIDI